MMGTKQLTWIRWTALGVLALSYLAPLWLYAYFMASYGLVEPGWTASEWRLSTRGYYLWLAGLAGVVVIALLPVWFFKSRHRRYLVLIVVSPLVGMILFRAYFLEIYPPWDIDLWIEWRKERGGYIPQYIIDGDEVYWERKRLQEAEEEAGQ